MTINRVLFLIFMLLIFQEGKLEAQDLKPYSENPYYWEYKGKPVLLIGAFNGAHNVFIEPDMHDSSVSLTAQMDEMVNAGGNVMRCVLDPGKAVSYSCPPWGKNSAGRFNLNYFASGSNSYWGKFEYFLHEAEKRDIIVQIEVWDRFDWQGTRWNDSGFNPKNNANYTAAESGLATSYSSYQDNPFSNSTPGHPDYESASGSQKAKYDLIRKYQKKFIDQVISVSFKFGNILYTMNNETHVDPTWGQYWIKYIRNAATAKGKTVHLTDMLDDGWDLRNSEGYRQIFSKPEIYSFVDISQVNAMKVVGGPEAHWANILYTRNQISNNIRPMNNTKVYGSDDQTCTRWQLKTYKRFGHLAGQNNFWMNLIGGCASVRFHRPIWGMGLGSVSKACLRAARKLETKIKMWEIEPRNDLLSMRGTHSISFSGLEFSNEPFVYGEAYLAAKPGSKYALYFTKGGSVDVNLTSYAKTIFNLYWINIDTGAWGSTQEISGGEIVRIDAPTNGAWVAAIVVER